MTAQLARMEFAPPSTPGLVRALVLAILAHALLLVVLATGVQWRHKPVAQTVEAELWSALPQEAAPRAAEPEPEPVVAPLPPKEVAPPPPTPGPDPASAIAQDKDRLQKEKDREKQLQLEKLQAEKKLKEKEAREKLARDKAEADKKRQQEQKVQDAKNAAEAKTMAELRQQNLQRMAGLAAGTGSANSTGTAAQASGPSAGYGGRIRARIKPNITFTDTTTDNPTAEVEVRTSPDGTIISRKLTKSSGLKSWDDAVLNAIDKTEVLPKDVDGRVPTSLIISFRPRD